MWSDSFRAEERAALVPGRLDTLLSSLAATAGAAALAFEVVMSVAVTTHDLTTRNASWPLGLLAIALGALGPYGTAAAWRSRRNADKPVARRVAAAAVVALSLGCLALAWLLLIRTSQSHPALLPF